MTQFAAQLKNLRIEQNLSMQDLADLAKVSKSMISKIEAGNVQPTLDIATKLAQALGKSLSSLLETIPKTPMIKLAAGEHPLWEDPQTHSLRKVLSPPFPDVQLEWLEVTLPPKTELSLSALKKGSEKYILVIEGELSVRMSEQTVTLSAQDSGYLTADLPHHFINSSAQPARYYLIIKY